MNRAIIQQAEDNDKSKNKNIIESFKNIDFSEIDRAGAGAGAGAVAKRGGGRPAGSKNKSKEIKEQERLKKQAKRDARERRREDILRRSGYITDNPQTN